MDNLLHSLKKKYEESEAVWFLVDLRFRIMQFNQKAAQNSIAYHNKKLAAGASILDYARDTKNKIDAEFIRCFGRASNGEPVEQEEEIVYHLTTIRTRTSYTPVYDQNKLVGVSVLVNTIT